MQLELPFSNETVPASETLRARVLRLTDELLQRAREHWPAAEIPDVRVEFRLRGRSAGEACGRTAVTNYNTELLERHGDDFIRDIVPHEVAHVVASRVFEGRLKPHGREWKLVMALYGARASATHCFPTKPARLFGRFEYRCRCDESHYLTKRAHLRIRRRFADYTCRVCRDKLEFTGRAAGRAASASR